MTMPTGAGAFPPPGGSPPPSPQSGSNRTKWVLGGLAILVVIVLTVVVTLLVTRDGSNSGGTPASASPSTSPVASDVASANDRGPAGIITEDPTCAAWEPIAQGLSQRETNGWDRRDPSRNVSEWTPEERDQYSNVAEAMQFSANQTVALIGLTPHRVMRELYEQTIAYWRLYADQAVSKYSPEDDHLALVATSTSNALSNICMAIDAGSAASRSVLVVTAPPPLTFSSIGDPANPSIFMTATASVCQEWIENSTTFQTQTAEWLKLDPNVPESAWTSEQRDINAAAVAVMSRDADTLQDLGMRSRNPVFSDFATAASQYRRAFVQSATDYLPADTYLANAASQLVVANDQACRAAEPH